MAANMDTVGTFEVAKEMTKHSLFTTIDKHFTLEEWLEFATKNPEALEVSHAYFNIRKY
jgi:GMP reductase